jgi:hypothetical protein
MGLFGISFGSGSKTNTSTSNNYDQRVVNDNSGAGTADNGAVATTVQGSGNTVTDSGAFAIVDKLVSQIGQVATAQTNVARDIALRDTTQGTTYAQAAADAQAAALTEAQFPKTAVYLAVGLALFYLARKFK